VIVPNAATYIAQKLLIHAKRKSEDRARDLLYIHDTLDTFGASLRDVRGVWVDSVAPRLPDRRRKQVERLARELFSDVTDAIRGAARIAISVGRTSSPESILEVCQVGLERVFAGG
jgi:hypothetical protein